MPPRNLIICCDGTNNEFGSQNTNVVRVIQCLQRDPTQQMFYYDPGVGTLPEPSWWPWIWEKISRWSSLAFGIGLMKNVEEAYAYLMDVWKPGDRVFLFGFSRGAYSVRVLAGLLHTVGLLEKDNDNLLPYAIRLYKGLRKSKTGDASNKYWKISDEFRRTFGRDTGERDHRFPIHFMGVWDTVSSVGWAWEPQSFPFTFRNPGLKIVRHAVAIDERRAFFRQNLFGNVDGQDLKEHWFAGVHSDVGGGYPEQDGGLWRAPFEWVLDAAVANGLLVDKASRENVLARTSDRSWAHRQHESLTFGWWPAEFFPKVRATTKFRVRFNCGRPRSIPRGSLIDRAAILRIREVEYSPRSLSSDVQAKVRALDKVSEEFQV